jgi:hypothetical protein
MDIHQAFSLLAYWLPSTLMSMSFEYPSFKQLRCKFAFSKPQNQAQRAHSELQKVPSQPKLDVLLAELMRVILSLVRGASSWRSVYHVVSIADPRYLLDFSQRLPHTMHMQVLEEASTSHSTTSLPSGGV